MIRLGKFILGFIGIVLALFILLAIFINQVLPKDKIKALIHDQVLAYTGRNLTIQGQLDVSIIPWVGIDVHDVTLDSPKGYNAPLAKIDTITFKLAFFPLFAKKIEVNTILLKGAQLYLAQKSARDNNWTFKLPTKPHSATHKPTQQQQKSQQAAEGNFAMPLFAAKNIQIQDAKATLILSPQAKYQLQDLNAQLKNVGLDKAFPLSLSFVLNTPQVKVTQQLKSQALLKLVNGQVDQSSIALSKLQSNTLIQRPKQADLKINFKGASTVDLAKDQATLTMAPLTVANASLTGKLQLNKLLETTQAKALAVSGNFKTSRFDLAKFLTTLGAKLNPKLVLKNASSEVQCIPSQDGQVQAFKFSGHLNDSSFKGTETLYLNHLKNPKYKNTLTIDRAHLTPYINAYVALPNHIKLDTQSLSLNSQLQLKPGWNADNYLNHLQGTIRANIGQAHLLGIDLVQMVSATGRAFNNIDSQASLAKAFSALGGIGHANQGAGKKTELTETQVNVKIQNGRSQFNYQSHALPDNWFKGSGTFNLHMPYDYFTRALLYRAGSQNSSQAVGIRFPFYAKGAIATNELQYGFDQDWFMNNEAPRLLQNALKNTIQRQINKHLAPKSGGNNSGQEKPIDHILKQLFQ